MVIQTPLKRSYGIAGNWGWLLSWFAEAYQLIDKTVLADQLIENIVIKRDTFAGTGAFDILHEIRVRKPGETN